MVQIAPIGLQYNPKTFWFDSQGLDLEVGDEVIVLTERGTEYGRLTEEMFDATAEQLEELPTALKPVLRKATEEDKALRADLEEKSKEALPVFRKFAAEMEEEMSPVAVEYLFDGDKAVFYFSAEDRVDFRDLVRKLAAHFHVRVDMRQIGVRDEARVIGGIGHCGQELCCKRLGGEFEPVSIRMAKEQDLSLNPVKISGVCGRLMCCLRYEFETYKECKCRCPKMGASIETPEGCAKVCNINVPQEIISLRTEEGKVVKVPLDDMGKEEGAQRPSYVDEQVYEAAINYETIDAVGPLSTDFTTSLFTGTDKLVDKDAQTQKNKESSYTKDQEHSAKSKRKPRRRHTLGKNQQANNMKHSDKQKKHASNGANDKNNQDKLQQKTNSSRRRRRSHTISVQQSQVKTKEFAAKPAKKSNTRAKQALRPGQNSSALRSSRKQVISEPKTTQARRLNQKTHSDVKNNQRSKTQRKHESTSAQAQHSAPRKTPAAHRSRRPRRTIQISHSEGGSE